ncbi:MAG: PAS domain-containing protein [Thermodesulfobacteriota bacterium]
MPLEPATLIAQLGCLFENEFVGIVVVRDGVVVASNACFARMLGLAEGGEVAGRRFSDLSAPGDCQDVAASLVDPEQVVDGPQGEIFLLREDTTYMPCRCSRAAQCLAKGQEPPAVVLFVQDVSEYYRLAEDYNKSMLDLEEAKLVQEENANVLSDMLVQLEQAERAKLEKEKLQGVVELAVAAAHELSQPLQAMQNDLFYLRGVVPEGGEEAAALDALDGAMVALEKIVAKFRTVTAYRTTEYTKGVTMFDLDGSSSGKK